MQCTVNISINSVIKWSPCFHSPKSRYQLTIWSTSKNRMTTLDRHSLPLVLTRNRHKISTALSCPLFSHSFKRKLLKASVQRSPIEGKNWMTLNVSIVQLKIIHYSWRVTLKNDKLISYVCTSLAFDPDVNLFMQIVAEKTWTNMYRRTNEYPIIPTYISPLPSTFVSLLSWTCWLSLHVHYLTDP